MARRKREPIPGTQNYIIAAQDLEALEWTTRTLIESAIGVSARVRSRDS